MEGESFEKIPIQKNRLKNLKFFAKVRDAVAERFDDLATDPSLRNIHVPLDLGDKVRRGEKVESFRLIRDALIGVGDDLRLTRDEIDMLQDKILKATPYDHTL